MTVSLSNLNDSITKQYKNNEICSYHILSLNHLNLSQFCRYLVYSQYCWYLVNLINLT